MPPRGAAAVFFLAAVFACASVTGAPRNPALDVGGPTRALVTPAQSLGLPNLTSNTSYLDLGQSLNVSLNGSAVTGGSGNVSNLSFEWSGLPTNCTTENVSNYTCTPTSAGAYTISVNVTDFSANLSADSAPVNITVNPDPEVVSIVTSATNLSLGQSVTFTVVANGGTPPLQYVFTGLPAGCAGNTSTVVCQPTAAAEYNVSVYVEDAVNTTSSADFVVVHVVPPSTPSAQVTTADWAFLVGLLVVGFSAVVYLLVRARREERIDYFVPARKDRVPPSPSDPHPPSSGGSAPPGPPTI